MADEKNISELEALKTDVKEHFRDICEICKYYEVHVSECECECDVCSLDCVCSTCFDCNKWEWRGMCAIAGTFGKKDIKAKQR